MNKVRPRPLPVATAMLAAVLAMATTTLIVPAQAEELSGLEISRRSDRARRSQNEYSVMTMTLENHRGQTRVRTIENWSREVSEDEDHRFSRFLEPSDVRDTTLLTYDHTHKNDDTWLYLPALKKVKRILSSNKKDYFMGSDFSYEDMENTDLVNWDYKLTASETLDGVDCYVVEGVPNNEAEATETAYSKTVMWIGKDDFHARRVHYFDKKGRLAKRMRAYDIKPPSPGEKRTRAHRMTMENLIKRHKTTLEFRDIQLDADIPAGTFSQRNLRQ